VIPADVEVLDLDPAQWATLNKLVLEARALRRWGYVLHSAGSVLTRHPEGLDVTPGQPVGDPVGLAQRLRAEGGYDRVVVIDRERLPALGRAAAELVEPGGALTRYRELVDELYWSSPAVATSPERPANPWRELRLRTEALGGGLVLVDVYDGSDVPLTSVALTVSAGCVTRISSPSAGEEPDVVLALHDRDLVAALCSSDLVSHLLDSASRDPRSRGLGHLSNDVPVPTTPQEGLTVHAS
jgi:hypothetical protein